MKITEAKLRQMIRGVIREFVSTGTAAGAEKKGYQSAERKSAQSDYDAKSADFDTKSAAYDDAVAARDDSKRYRKSTKGGGYTYSATMPRVSAGWGTNPDWITQNADVTTKGGDKLAAQGAKTTASTTLDTKKASDLEKEKPKQKQQTGGGGAGFGKGKSAGKGKGKKKK